MQFIGLGLGKLESKNWALLAKWWWRSMEERDALWRRVTVAKYGVDEWGWIPSRVPRYKVLCLWRKIWRFRNMFSVLEGFLLGLGWVLKLERGAVLVFGWMTVWVWVICLLSFPRFFGVVSTSYLWLRIVILVRVALCLGLCLLGVCVSWKHKSLGPYNTNLTLFNSWVSQMFVYGNLTLQVFSLQDPFLM